MGEAGEYSPKPTNWRGTTMRRSLTELRPRRGDQLRTVHGRETSSIEAKMARPLGPSQEVTPGEETSEDLNSHRTNASVTSPLHDSRLHWVHDPQPRQTPSVPPSHSPSSPVNPPVPRINDSVPRITKTVPRNVYPPPRKESTSISIAPSSDVRVHAPLTRIDSSVWQNSSQEICPPSAQE